MNKWVLMLPEDLNQPVALRGDSLLTDCGPAAGLRNYDDANIFFLEGIVAMYCLLVSKAYQGFHRAHTIGEQCSR